MIKKCEGRSLNDEIEEKETVKLDLLEEMERVN